MIRAWCSRMRRPWCAVICRVYLNDRDRCVAVGQWFCLAGAHCGFEKPSGFLRVYTLWTLFLVVPLVHSTTLPLFPLEGVDEVSRGCNVRVKSVQSAAEMFGGRWFRACVEGETAGATQ